MTDDELDQRLRETILAEEIDTSRLAEAVHAQIMTRRVHVRGWAVAAAGVLAMFAAGLTSYRAFLKEHAPPSPICIAAAQDHQREIVDGEPRQWLTDLSAIQSLARKQGVAVSTVVALGNTGYRLERGRLCFLQKQIFVHLVYSRNGSRYSVYLRSLNPALHDDSRIDHSIREASVGRERSAFFQTNQLTAVFVGQRDDVAAFARAGAEVLQGSGS